MENISRVLETQTDNFVQNYIYETGVLNLYSPKKCEFNIISEWVTVTKNTKRSLQRKSQEEIGKKLK